MAHRRKKNFTGRINKVGEVWRAERTGQFGRASSQAAASHKDAASPSLKTISDLFTCLKTCADGSPSARKVAAYVEHHYTKIVFMTAYQVAQESGVSQGSVSRFCVALGFAGYNDFRQSLQHIQVTGLTAPQRLERLSRESAGLRSSLGRARDEARAKHEQSLRNDMEAIAELKPVLESEQYDCLIDALAKTPHVILTSARISATMLPYFAYTLNKMRPGVDLVLPGNQAWDLLGSEDPETTVIVTTVFPRYSEQLMRKLEHLHALGFHIIALTDSRVSPAVSVSETALSLPVNISSTFDDYVALSAFFTVLLEDLAARIDGLSDRIVRIDQQEIAEGAYRL